MGNQDKLDEEMTVEFNLDDGTTVVCAIITILEVEGQDYIVLLPLDENGENENGDVFLYRYIDTDPEAPDLENIIDDDEYEAAADAFDEWMDAQEFEYLEDEE